MQKAEEKIIIVRIPPEYDENLSMQERYWQVQKFLFPQIEIPNPIPQGLPHDDSLLYITLEEDKSIKINNQKVCNLVEINLLQNELQKVFTDREKSGAFERQSNNKVLKAVLISASDSAKYEEVFKVVEATKNAGADPIILRIGRFPTERIVNANNR